MKRRQQFLLQDRLAHLFASKKKTDFWAHVNRLIKPHSSDRSPSVDGVSMQPAIANVFASKFSALLNRHQSSSCQSLFAEIQSTLTPSHISSLSFSENQVAIAISQLKLHKSDADGICSEHIKLASPIIAESLASFFTAAVRHGYMPKLFRDSVLVPVPKGKKDTSTSNNYRPIALSSNFSKVLERVILMSYESFFKTSDLQFGFKTGSSTTLCTGVIKNVISRYTHRGSSVLGCFLDASKAFDLVDHQILFRILLERGLPLPIVHFLLSWYTTLKVQVRWGTHLSDPFSVSNGVRQGSILSPHLFAIYIDGLLIDLMKSGVGCYWGCSFAGAFAYADDVVLLAPSASALRTMLDICSSFAVSHKLEFNGNKTQLISFTAPGVSSTYPTILFNNICLTYSDQVLHLGHILTNGLDDTADILRATREINIKANFLLHTLHSTDVLTKTFLFKSYCLPLYGCSLWSLGSPSIKTIDVALNKILRKVWKLPSRSHTGVVHCVARVSTISNILFQRFHSLLSKASSSSSTLIRTIFRDSTFHPFSFAGYNFCCGHHHLREYTTAEINKGLLIRSIRNMYGLSSPFESVILFCSLS